MGFEEDPPCQILSHFIFVTLHNLFLRDTSLKHWDTLRCLLENGNLAKYLWFKMFFWLLRLTTKYHEKPISAQSPFSFDCRTWFSWAGAVSWNSRWSKNRIFIRWWRENMDGYVGYIFQMVVSYLSICRCRRYRKWMNDRCKARRHLHYNKDVSNVINL